MKRFHFSLRPVAILRSHEEMRARESFAAAVQARVQAQERLAAARRRVAELSLLLFQSRGRCFLAAEAAALLRVHRRECEAEAEAVEALTIADKTVASRRADYLLARRRLKIVHRLEEKARLAHRRELGREEQKELDELAIRRAEALPILT